MYLSHSDLLCQKLKFELIHLLIFEFDITKRKLEILKRDEKKKEERFRTLKSSSDEDDNKLNEKQYQQKKELRAKLKKKELCEAKLQAIEIDKWR